MNIIILILLANFIPVNHDLLIEIELPTITVTTLSCETEQKILLLAGLITAEADNQPVDGKIKVADVVFNRINSNKYPNTIDSVIMQNRQFAKFHGKRFIVNEESYKIAYKTYFKGPTSKYLGFLNPSISTNLTHVKWAVNRPGRYIGDHYFHI